MLMSAHGCFMSAHEWIWMLKSANERSLVLISAHGTMLMRAYVCSWAFTLGLKSTHKYTWAVSTHKYGAMAPTALLRANEHSWAWSHGAIITHSALAPYSSVLMSAHGAFECSWVFLSDSECLSFWFRNKRKMLIFEMTSFYLTMSWSRYHQIIKKNIVLKSRGCLKKCPNRK